MKENAYKPSDWLPTSVKEVRARGWDTLDVILFTATPMSIIRRSVRPWSAACWRPRACAWRSCRSPTGETTCAISASWDAEAVLRRIGRQHGLDGQPLHGQQKAAQRRRLHRRRTSRIPARLCGHGLHAHPEAAVPRHAGRARRHRGLAAEAHALRLLERLAEAVDPYRQRSRPCWPTAWATG